MQTPIDDPTLRAVYNVLLEAKGVPVTSRELKDAAGMHWQVAVRTLVNTFGMKIETFLGGSGNQSFRLLEPIAPAVEAVEPPATQMHPGIDPLVRGPQLLTEPFPLPYPDPAPPTIHPPATTLVGAMLPDMVASWQKQHGDRPTGIVLPFALKSNLREFTTDIRRLGLRVFFGDVTEATFVLEGTALLYEDAHTRPRPDALY
jgi:hypothetical protein